MNETIKKIDAYLEQFVGSTMEQIIMQEAKREIEKLIKERDEADAECREANASWCREIEESIDLNRELAAAIKQRDEARCRICNDSLRMGRVFRRIEGQNVECSTPQDVAEMMGWDCFKENNK
jgi:hypothetical protein